MLLVDCPLCDTPAPLDVDAGAIDCARCATRLEIARDEPALELAPAA